MARNDSCRQDVFLEEDAGPLVCLLTFLCLSHSSSMLQPVLLKTELVEKGFALWKERKNNEWMYPCPLKSHRYLQHVPKELAKQRPLGLFGAEDTSEHSQFFRKTLSSSQREFWDTVTAISAPAFSSLCRTLRGHFTRYWLMMVTHLFPDTDQRLLLHSPSPSSMEIQHTCYHLSVMLKIFRRLTLGVRKIL